MSAGGNTENTGVAAGPGAAYEGPHGWDGEDSDSVGVWETAGSSKLAGGRKVASESGTTHSQYNHLEERSPEKVNRAEKSDTMPLNGKGKLVLDCMGAE